MVLNKIRRHVWDIATYKSLPFVFYRTLEIINRKIPLPSAIFKYNITGVSQEEHLKKWMYPLDNGCFIDVGANVGYWTNLVASRGFTVHAIEPSPIAFKVLERRMKDKENVFVYPIALGDDIGIFNFRLYESFSTYSVMGSLANPAPRGEETYIGTVKVPVTTIDSLDFEDVGLIKIDTEGFEIPVLMGAEQTIKVWKPRLVTEVHPPYDEQLRKICDVYKKFGYWCIIEYKKEYKCDNPQPHIIGEYA